MMSHRYLEAFDELHKCTYAFLCNSDLVETASRAVAAAEFHAGMLMHAFTSVV